MDEKKLKHSMSVLTFELQKSINQLANFLTIKLENKIQKVEIDPISYIWIISISIIPNHCKAEYDLINYEDIFSIIEKWEKNNSTSIKEYFDNWLHNFFGDDIYFTENDDNMIFGKHFETDYTLYGLIINDTEE